MEVAKFITCYKNFKGFSKENESLTYPDLTLVSWLFLNALVKEKLPVCLCQQIVNNVRANVAKLITFLYLQHPTVIFLVVERGDSKTM